MDVDYPSHFQFQVIEDVILYGGTVTAPKTGTKNALLAIVPLNRVQKIVILPQNLDQGISTAIINSCHKPASHPQSAKRSAAGVSHGHFVLHARHVLQTTPSYKGSYLQLRTPVAMSCPNNLSRPSKGLLHTQNARERQSEVYLM